MSGLAVGAGLPSDKVLPAAAQGQRGNVAFAAVLAQVAAQPPVVDPRAAQQTDTPVPKTRGAFAAFTGLQHDAGAPRQDIAADDPADAASAAPAIQPTATGQPVGMVPFTPVAAGPNGPAETASGLAGIEAASAAGSLPPVGRPAAAAASPAAGPPVQPSGPGAATVGPETGPRPTGTAGQPAVSQALPVPPASQQPAAVVTPGPSPSPTATAPAATPIPQRAPPGGQSDAAAVTSAASIAVASVAQQGSSTAVVAQAAQPARPQPIPGRQGPAPIAAGGPVGTGRSAVAPAASAPSEPEADAEPAPVAAPSRSAPQDEPPAAPAAVSPSADASATANPAQQIVAALQALVLPGGSVAASPATSPAAASAGGPVAAAQPRTGQPGALREVTIQLDPEHLGSVAIRMRMIDGQIDIRIEVANGQTLDLLNRDRHVLTAAVDAAGGQPDSLVLAAQPRSETGTADRSAGGWTASADPNGRPAPDQMASFGGNRDQRDDRSTSQILPTGPSDDETAPTQTTAPDRDGGLYV